MWHTFKLLNNKMNICESTKYFKNQNDQYWMCSISKVTTILDCVCYSLLLTIWSGMYIFNQCIYAFCYFWERLSGIILFISLNVIFLRVTDIERKCKSWMFHCCVIFHGWISHSECVVLMGMLTFSWGLLLQKWLYVSSGMQLWEMLQILHWGGCLQAGRGGSGSCLRSMWRQVRFRNQF